MSCAGPRRNRAFAACLEHSAEMESRRYLNVVWDMDLGRVDAREFGSGVGADACMR